MLKSRDTKPWNDFAIDSVSRGKVWSLASASITRFESLDGLLVAVEFNPMKGSKSAFSRDMVYASDLYAWSNNRN